MFLEQKISILESFLNVKLKTEVMMLKIHL